MLITFDLPKWRVTTDNFANSFCGNKWTFVHAILNGENSFESNVMETETQTMVTLCVACVVLYNTTKKKYFFSWLTNCHLSTTFNSFSNSIVLFHSFLANWQRSFPIDRRRWLIDLKYSIMIASHREKKIYINIFEHTNRHNSIYYCVVNWRLWICKSKKINSIDNINSISTTTTKLICKSRT